MNEPSNDTPTQFFIEHIRRDGPIRFDHWMQKALYDPTWGYYSRGDFIFGAQGDFVTAPELTPLFGQTLAKALTPLVASGLNTIYEFGAGQGKLARDLLSELAPHLNQYVIVELSAHLKQRQEQTIREGLPEETANKVRWVTSLPDQIDGIVLGNELLDAMPVRRFKWTSDAVLEAFVAESHEKLTLDYQPADPDFTSTIQQLNQKWGPWPDGYESEVCEQVPAFMHTITKRLNGFGLMIDYGMHAQQYYQAMHQKGHLRAHSKHTAHDDFLFAPGQQDLTCHVDFTATYEALEQAGGALEGYCSQATFLLHHGLMDLASKAPELTHPTDGGELRQALNTLTSEAAMGQSFKVMAWSRNYELPEGPLTTGFLRGDLSHQL